MKKLLFFAGFLLILNLSCKQTDAVIDPIVDQRDQRVGVYICEVRIENYSTKQVLSSYSDTLKISKQGDMQLLIKSSKGAQLPVLKSMDSVGRTYAGLLTVLSFNQGELSLVNGPDAEFYNYKGRKLQ